MIQNEIPPEEASIVLLHHDSAQRSYLLLFTSNSPALHLALYSTEGMFHSRILSWCIQRVANLSLVALLCLMFLAFWCDRPAPRQPDDSQGASRRAGKGRHHHFRPQITNSQLALVYYTLFVHVLGLLFPIRLCYAVRSMIKNLRIQQQAPQPRKRLAKIQFRTTESESGCEDSTSSDFSESEIELSTESEYEDDPLVHAIILPNYKEDMDTLRETLEVLASHQLASSSYEVRRIRLKT